VGAVEEVDAVSQGAKGPPQLAVSAFTNCNGERFAFGGNNINLAGAVF